MVFADSSRSQFAYIEELNWGTTPAAPLKAFRFTGESTNFNIDSTQSNEIRSDRQITDLIQNDAQPGGEVNFELSYGALDDFLEGSLFNTWNTVALSGSTFAAVAGAPDSITDSNNGFITAGIKAGQWLKLSGFSQVSNNGYVQVLTVSAGTLTVKGEISLVNEPAGATVTMTGRSLRNGVVEKSYSLQTAFEDVGQYKVFKGMQVNTLSLNLSVGEILNGTLGFMGKDAVISNSSIGVGAMTPAPTNDVLNAVNNVAYIAESGTPFSTGLQEFTLSLSNNLRAQKSVGALGNIGIGVGRGAITGTFNAYFENSALYNKYLNNQETSLSMRITDISGNSYIITLPRIKFSSGTLAAGAPDTDVILEMEYQALRHPIYDFTIQIDSFPA